MSGGITPSELRSLKEEAESWMTSRVTIRRNAPILPGGATSPRVVASGVLAGVTPGFGVFREVADRYQGVTSYVFRLPLDADIKPGDDVEMEGVDPPRKFNILSVREQATIHTAKLVLAEMIH